MGRPSLTGVRRRSPRAATTAPGTSSSLSSATVAAVPRSSSIRTSQGGVRVANALDDDDDDASCTSSGGRSAVSSSSSSSTGSDPYPRRFPRLGDAYQAATQSKRLPKLGQALAVRPPPCLFSPELPHALLHLDLGSSHSTPPIQEEEGSCGGPVDAAAEGHVSSSSKPKEVAASMDVRSTTSMKQYQRQPPVLLHAAGEGDPVLQFLSPIYAPTAMALNDEPRPRTTTISNPMDGLDGRNESETATAPDIGEETEEMELLDWVRQVADWHRATTSPPTDSEPVGRRVKSRYKRPPPPAAPCVRPSSLSMAHGHWRKRPPRLAPEDEVDLLHHACKRLRSDPTTLEPVSSVNGRLQHHDYMQLQHGALVELCGGRARSARRQKKKRSQAPSWREALRRTLGPPLVYGDYRDPDLRPFFSQHESVTAKVNANEWEALLAYAQALRDEREHLNLSEVVGFCHRMTQLQLPPPDTFELNRRMEEYITLFLDDIEACKARESLVMDLWQSNGVDLDSLRKLIDAPTPCHLDWSSERLRQLDVADEWQQRVVQVLDTSGELADLEALAKTAKAWDLRPRGLVTLEHKLARAVDYRSRIVVWKASTSLESVKLVASLVKDVTKLGVSFPEALQLVECHQNIESWVDRAGVAIRSRISLQEIKDLLRTSKELPVDLAEYTEKLLSRERAADDWLLRFANIVPSATTIAEEMAFARRAMQTNYNSLHELASEGSRIPVEMETVKWLQVELDGRNWSVKANKWIPGADESRKGKLEDLKEHMEKAASLHRRMSSLLAPPVADPWCLDGERVLKRIVEEAERWFDDNRELLDYDSRKSEARPRLSISKLRQVHQDGNSIFINLGSSATKVSKVLAQAESWLDTYSDLIHRCHPGKHVQVSELIDAVNAASAEISVDLDEARNLSAMAERITEWLDAADAACGNRRANRHKRPLSLEKLTQLINEARVLPIDTADHLRRLTQLRSEVQDWQKKALSNLEQINLSFQKFREALDESYGPPAQFSSKLRSKSKPPESADCLEEKSLTEEHSISSVESEQDPCALLNYGENSVAALVADYVKQAQAATVRTPESELSSEIDAVCRWLNKSVKYLEDQREVFDKRFFGAFDRILVEGKEFSNAADVDRLEEDCVGVTIAARATWTSVVSDQIERLDIILQERERYNSWCRMATGAIDEQKLSVEALLELYKQSTTFSIQCDTIRKVRRLQQSACEWIQSTGERLANGEKFLLQDAKAIVDEGEKLGVSFKELRVLRNGLKAANGWATRVKRCRPESGSTNVKSVMALLKEHDTLIIELPDEVRKLQKSLKNYCICRRPYDGFMIGCDTCDDWFHGPCIGVSETKAGKVDKYICLRCSVSKIYESSAATIASAIRKWTSSSDCKKSRQSDGQRQQRKIRKEVRDIEKLKENRERVLRELSVTTARGPQLLNSDSLPAMNETLPAQLDVPPDVATSPNDAPAPVAVLESTEPEAESLSIEELQTRLAVIEKSLIQSEARLVKFNTAMANQRNEEEIENINAGLLRKFVLVVRSCILVPVSQSLADASRPGLDGSLSPPMQAIMDDAEKLGLLRFKDVQEVFNAFRCLSWSRRAAIVLAKHPNVEDVESLVRLAAEMHLPDEKALRTLKALLQRARSWQLRVSKAIAPDPTDSKPYNLEYLSDLASQGENIPLCMPFEARLVQIIDDKGCRHCLCGGPSDGRFMLSCDKCERWFHGHCVGVSKEESSSLEDWQCPSCRGTVVDVTALNLNEFHSMYDFCDVESEEDGEPDSSDASVASKAAVAAVWPPYGLLDSEKAVEVLGPTAVTLPCVFELLAPIPSASTPATSIVFQNPTLNGDPAQALPLIATAIPSQSHVLLGPQGLSPSSLCAPASISGQQHGFALPLTHPPSRPPDPHAMTGLPPGFGMTWAHGQLSSLLSPSRHPLGLDMRTTTTVLHEQGASQSLPPPLQPSAVMPSHAWPLGGVSRQLNQNSSNNSPSRPMAPP